MKTVICLALQAILLLEMVLSLPMDVESEKEGKPKEICPTYSNFYGYQLSHQGCCVNETTCSVQLQVDEEDTRMMSQLRAISMHRRRDEIKRRKKRATAYTSVSQNPNGPNEKDKPLRVLSLCRSNRSTISPVFATSARSHDKVQLIQLPPLLTQSIVVHTCQEKETPFVRGLCKQTYKWESVYVVTPKKDGSSYHDVLFTYPQEVLFKKEWILVGAGCELRLFADYGLFDESYFYNNHDYERIPKPQIYGKNYVEPGQYYGNGGAPTTNSQDPPTTAVIAPAYVQPLVPPAPPVQSYVPEVTGETTQALAGYPQGIPSANPQSPVPAPAYPAVEYIPGNQNGEGLTAPNVPSDAAQAYPPGVATGAYGIEPISANYVVEYGNPGDGNTVPAAYSLIGRYDGSPVYDVGPQLNPPPVDLTPPLVETTPPPAEVTPPTVETPPPTAETTPPPVAPTPPPAEPTPPPAEPTPPPAEPTPPPAEPTPPPAEPTPPPAEPTPPPAEPIPPPLDSTTANASTINYPAIAPYKVRKIMPSGYNATVYALVPDSGLTQPDVSPPSPPAEIPPASPPAETPPASPPAETPPASPPAETPPPSPPAETPPASPPTETIISPPIDTGIPPPTTQIYNATGYASPLAYPSSQGVGYSIEVPPSAYTVLDNSPSGNPQQPPASGQYQPYPQPANYQGYASGQGQQQPQIQAYRGSPPIPDYTYSAYLQEPGQHDGARYNQNAGGGPAGGFRTNEHYPRHEYGDDEYPYLPYQRGARNSGNSGHPSGGDVPRSPYAKPYRAVYAPPNKIGVPVYSMKGNPERIRELMHNEDHS